TGSRAASSAAARAGIAILPYRSSSFSRGCAGRWRRDPLSFITLVLDVSMSLYCTTFSQWWQEVRHNFTANLWLYDKAATVLSRCRYGAAIAHCNHHDFGGCAETHRQAAGAEPGRYDQM